MKLKTLKPNQFPALLKEINDPPEELWLEGEMPSEDATFLAVVGTRKYSNYGEESCKKLIAGLAGYNIVIVSGLALGIDALAHHAALDAGLKTIAVPGSGISRKVLHPRTNHKLADKIVEQGGALLSEFEPEMPAGIHTFPQRNRIIAGLSQATLVVEGPERSGTLITARLALEYNRDVFAVPGSIFSRNSEGSNRLIKQGAAPITSSKDLLEALGIEIKSPNDEEIKRADISDKERAILEILGEPLPKDELLRKSGLSATEINPLLMIMEVKDLIKESGGKIYRL